MPQNPWASLAIVDAPRGRFAVIGDTYQLADVMLAGGGKWNRSLGAWIFRTRAAAEKAVAPIPVTIEEGERASPDDIAALMRGLGKLRKVWSFESHDGTGRLAAACLERKIRGYGGLESLTADRIASLRRDVGRLLSDKRNP